VLVEGEEEVVGKAIREKVEQVQEGVRDLVRDSSLTAITFYRLLLPSEVVPIWIKKVERFGELPFERV